MKEDKTALKEKSYKSAHEYFALVYRSENKRIIQNQIILLKILSMIIERMMKGMTLQFSVTRVFEFESKKEMAVNRLMLSGYLDALERGMEANKQLYLQQRGLQEADLQKMAEHNRYMSEGNRAQQRQFEVVGY